MTLVTLTDAARSRGQGVDKFRRMDEIDITIDDTGNIRLAAVRDNSKDDDDVTQAFLSFPIDDAAEVIAAISDLIGKPVPVIPTRDTPVTIPDFTAFGLKPISVTINLG